VCGEAVCLFFPCDWVCTAAPDNEPRRGGRLWAPRQSNPSSGPARHRQLQRIIGNGCRDWAWRCAREDLLMRAWGGCSSGRHAAGAEWHAHGNFVGKTAILQMTRPLQDASDLPARAAHATPLGLLRIRRQPCPHASGCHLLHLTASRALYTTSGQLSTCSNKYMFASCRHFLVRICHFSAAMPSAATGRF